MADTGTTSRHPPLFFVFVLLAGYLSYLILGPFLTALGWAAIFAIMFRRLQVKLAPKIGPNRAALVVTLLAALAIIGPVATLVSALAREAPQVTAYLQETSRTAPPRIEEMWAFVKSHSPVALPDDPTALLAEGGRRAAAFLAPRAGAVVADAFGTLGSLALMLFALFFLVRDGDAIGQHLRDLLPVPEPERSRLVQNTSDLVVASVGAGLVVAAAQGVIGGVAFWLLGMGAPALWGVAIAFCSLVPLVGAALVWVPAALWLFLSGDIARGVIMVVVGVLGISMVDNVLRPLLLSGRTSMNGLVIMLGLLGGAAAFGFIGLVIGPIILVTTGSLLALLKHRDPPDEAR